MSRRGWTGALVAVAAIGGILVAYDALIETDEERLEVFVDDVSGAVTQGRVELARSRWVDLERQSFEVSALGQSLLYQDGEQDALEQRTREALTQLLGAQLRVLSSGIVLEGDRATVSLRLLSQERGLSQVEWRLRKHGDDWLIERLAVMR